MRQVAVLVRPRDPLLQDPRNLSCLLTIIPPRLPEGYSGPFGRSLLLIDEFERH